MYYSRESEKRFVKPTLSANVDNHLESPLLQQQHTHTSSPRDQRRRFMAACLECVSVLQDTKEQLTTMLLDNIWGGTLRPTTQSPVETFLERLSRSVVTVLYIALPSFPVRRVDATGNRLQKISARRSMNAFAQTACRHGRSSYL